MAGPMGPVKEIVDEAEALISQATALEPLLESHTRRVKLAVAYFIAAAKRGESMSMYDAEELFGVSDSPFRKCYHLMSGALAFSIGHRQAKRKRNAYDLYAEILRNDGRNLNGYIRLVHVSHSELRKHLALLVSRGLLSEESGKGRGVYRTTEKGGLYLEAHKKLLEIIG